MVGHPTEAAKARGRSHGTTGICLLNGFSVSIVTLKIIVTSVRSLTLSVITRDFRTLCSGTSQFPRCAWRIPIPIPSSASASASPPQRSLPRVLCVASFPFISGAYYNSRTCWPGSPPFDHDSPRMVAYCCSFCLLNTHTQFLR